MTEQNEFDPMWETDIYSKGNQLNRYPYDNVVSFLFRNYPRDKNRADIKILEVGCGAGNNLWFAAREGFSVTGIDGSKSAIAFAQKRFEQDNLNGEFVVGDFTKLPFKADHFDIVIDRGAIVCCNLEAGKKAVSEALRVLHSGGKFLFNPYSQAHSSFACGKLQPDGLVTDITGGSLVGVGSLCFYSHREVLHAFSKEWDLLSTIHKEFRQLDKHQATTHAEWEVVAQKR